MTENNLVNNAINLVNKSDIAFTKFITANDTVATGAHQSGFYLHRNSYPLFFDKAGVKGSNKDKFVKIKWQGDFETESRFIYYGTGTRNEYRLTRFGRNFPFLQENNIGNLIVIGRITDDYYEAFVLSSDDDTEDFLSAFGLSPSETNRIIPKSNVIDIDAKLEDLFQSYIETLKVDFPTSTELADNARGIIIKAQNINTPEIKKMPDRELLRWLDTEYQLFKAIENDRYAPLIKNPFKSIDDFIKSANSVLQRRKSRAGKSLEHHLSKMFNIFELKFDEQPVTEGNKKPDFIFPDIESYRNGSFKTDKLIFLAAKTTCKDRWRQILNEADRIRVKHLFTLQQGISSNQLKEMYENDVKLVVPKDYISAYPKEYQRKIYSLGTFIKYVDYVQK
ncbi:restriction endonuclease [Candidatus Dojkabacteria bacterium]|nr:restriction endonuclease [Candidatus Dojkabacteria bacterium]